MALHAAQSSSTRLGNASVKAVAPAHAGRNLCWYDPRELPMLEWEKLQELFIVALTAKHSIPRIDLTRTDGTERKLAFMGGLIEKAAKEKVKSILFSDWTICAQDAIGQHSWTTLRLPIWQI